MTITQTAPAPSKATKRADWRESCRNFETAEARPGYVFVEFVGYRKSSYVAEVIGLSPTYGIARDFVPKRWHPNTWKRTFGPMRFELAIGAYYEIAIAVQADARGRRYVIVSAEGELVEIDADEIAIIAEDLESARS